MSSSEPPSATARNACPAKPSSPAASAAPLIEALLDPARGGGLTGTVQLVETHISWILLTDQHAYKIKKPVSLGFLDFGSLEARRHFCEEEVRLNRRLAPGLYLGVVPITGSVASPVLAGQGPAIEYAVQMKRFRTGDELDRRIHADPPSAEAFASFARRIAAFHAAAPHVDPATPWGRPEEILSHCVDNFALIGDSRDISALPVDNEAVAGLRTWTDSTFERLMPVILARRAQGFVRECHGDLHLANLVCTNEGIVAFDALEFSPGLRWIDVISEIAFTVMDLKRHRRDDLAQRFLDTWLAESGDYRGLALLPFYLVYRAMVRVKVGAIRWAQSTDAATRRALGEELEASISLAQLCSAPLPRCLLLTHGVSGSGKSHLAEALLEAGDWIRIRSDVERKRLAGMAPEERSDSPPGAGLYGDASTQATYARLLDLAREVLAAGYPVIVDATFLKRTQRASFLALARGLDIPLVILSAGAPQEVLEQRIRARLAQGRDPSEATPELLHAQLASQEPLGDEELEHAVVVDTSGALDVSGLNARVRGAFNRLSPAPR